MYCVIRYVDLADGRELEEFLHDGSLGFYTWGQRLGMKTFEKFSEATECAIELNELYGVPCCVPCGVDSDNPIDSLVIVDPS